MKLHENVTIDDLKKVGIPTFNQCEHYLIEPKNNVMQTFVIKLNEDKYMTVCVMPNSDNVDVKIHGSHKNSVYLSSDEDYPIYAFYNLK